MIFKYADMSSTGVDIISILMDMISILMNMISILMNMISVLIGLRLWNRYSHIEIIFINTEIIWDEVRLWITVNGNEHIRSLKCRNPTIWTYIQSRFRKGYENQAMNKSDVRTNQKKRKKIYKWLEKLFSRLDKNTARKNWETKENDTAIKTRSEYKSPHVPMLVIWMDITYADLNTISTVPVDQLTPAH